jgi:hypothetical protein
MVEVAISPLVSAADTWTPSRRMQSAATAERERVQRELQRLATREAELAAELAAVQAARVELEHQRDVLNHFVDEAQPTNAAGQAGRRLRALPCADATTLAGTTPLRGAQIREAAVRVLAANTKPETPVHYRDWFELLAAQGFMPAGKDPLATFLTQVGRSPVVQRTTTSGMYVLDLEFPKRARERLLRLASELAGAQELASPMTMDEIAAARRRRAQLATEMQEIERQLEEAVRSLGPA